MTDDTGFRDHISDTGLQIVFQISNLGSLVLIPDVHSYKVNVFEDLVTNGTGECVRWLRGGNFGGRSCRCFQSHQFGSSGNGVRHEA